MKQSFFALLFISFLLYTAACAERKNQITKEYPNDSLNTLLLQSVQSKRITFMTDNYHGHFYYENKIIVFLNFWIDSKINNKDDSTIPNKIVLFLEEDSSSTNSISKIFESGEISHYLNYAFENTIKFYGWEKFTLDKLRFFQELHDVKNRINIYNNSNNNKLDLVIKGSEPIPPNTSDFIIKKSNCFWIMKERDRLIAQNIINFLSVRNDYSAIVFYGSAHAKRMECDKRELLSSDIKKNFVEPIKDYYLAHFLDEQFGRNQVNVFWLFSDIYSNTSKIKKYKENQENSDYEVKGELIPATAFPIYFLCNQTFLKTLFELRYKYRNKIDLYNLNLRNTSYLTQNNKVDIALFISIERLLYFFLRHSYLNNELNYKNKIDSLVYYPMHLKDQNLAYSRTSAILSDLVNKFDVIKNIENISGWITKQPMPADSLLYLMSLKSVIYNLPRDTTIEVFSKELQYSFSNQNISEFELNQIQKRINDIKINVSINSLCINDYECNKLMTYLCHLTHKRFTKKEEWYNWWIKKYTYKNIENHGG